MGFSESEGMAEQAEQAEFGFSPQAQRRLNVNGKQFAYYAKVAVGRQRRSVFFLPVADPRHRLAIMWGIFITLFDLTYTAFIVPLAIAFVKTFWTGVSFLLIADWLGSIVYLADMLAGFHIGFLVLWDTRWVPITDGRLVSYYYLRHGAFFVNFCACLPLIVQIILASLDQDMQLLRFIFLLRLLRLWRVLMLIRALAEPGASGTLARSLQRWFSASLLLAWNAIFSLCVLLNLLGCIWWAIAVAEGLDNSWAAHVQGKVDVDLLTASNSVRYLYSVYFVMSTIATVGYGDILPTTTTEVGVALFYMIVGVAFFGYLINTVAAVISSTGPSREASMLSDNLQTLEAWMAERQLPVSLKGSLRSHFLNLWTMRDKVRTETQFYSQLPPHLRILVRDQLQSRNLGKCDIFERMSQESRDLFQGLINKMARPVVVFPGHHLYVKGEPARHFYVLDEGRMAASSGQGWVDVVFSGPAVVSLSALFSSHVPECACHSQTVTALSGCHLWQVDCLEIEQYLSQHHVNVLHEVAQLFLQHVKTLLQRSTCEGWNAPQALAQQRHKLAWMQMLVEGLQQHLAVLEVAVSVQRKREAEEDAVRKQLLAKAASAQQEGAGAAAAVSSSPGSGGDASNHSSPISAVAGSAAGGLQKRSISMALDPRIAHALSARAVVGQLAPELLLEEGGFMVSPSRRDLVLEVELCDVMKVEEQA